MTVRVGIVGVGGIARANHIPGLKLCPDTEIVALCDNNLAAVEKVSREAQVSLVFTDHRKMLNEVDIDAVVIATPTVYHAPVALDAIAAGRHVLCEKQLGMTYTETIGMVRAAEQAGVRHMTAFTYRFVPGMRYITHLIRQGSIGEPFHFRVQRFQDFGAGPIGWRQQKVMAGTGELGDMLAHRIDFAHLLIGPIRRVVSSMKQLLDVRTDSSGQGYPSDVEDWVGMLTDFENGATGVFESAKTATGRGFGGRSQDYCEINGSEGTLVYYLHRPNEIEVGRRGQAGLETVPVPEEFLKVPGSPRNPNEGDPTQTFRYDQSFEFIQAIQEGRPCSPSFVDGMRVQAVIDAAISSAETDGWVRIADVASEGYTW